jgi:uncharacterized DUF497 family protein
VLFEWDPAKAQRNQRKHGVSFQEAALAFDDPAALDDFDGAHSDQEARYRRIVASPAGRVLWISYTQRTHDGHETIRLIAARPATRHERRAYDALYPDRG